MATKKNMLGTRTTKSSQPKAQRYAANTKKLAAKKNTGTGSYVGKPVSVSPVTKSTSAKKPTNIGLVPMPRIKESNTPTRRRRRTGKKRKTMLL